MNLEQLQGLSDAELNRLSAEQVMELNWHYTFGMWLGNGQSYENWNPASDMNHAMKLLEGKEYVIMGNDETKVQIFKPHDEGKKIFYVTGSNLPRTIIIASILALE